MLLLKIPEPFAAIGIRTPVGPLMGPLLGFTVAFTVSALALRFARPWREHAERQLAGVAALLPVTKRERRLFALLAVSAGVCEEIVFRGFLFFYLGWHFPGLHPVAIAVITGVIFGWGHVYQGWKGVLTTAGMGVVFGVLYWQVGSIIPLMLIHAVIDLRTLLIPPKPAAATDAEGGA